MSNKNQTVGTLLKDSARQGSHPAPRDKTPASPVPGIHVAQVKRSNGSLATLHRGKKSR